MTRASLMPVSEGARPRATSRPSASR